MRKLCLGCILLLLAVALPLARSQTASVAQTAAAKAAAPTYDVVTIRLDKTTDPGSLDIDVSNDLFSAKNVSVKGLLQEAYGIKADLISGVPGSVDSARFDVEAKIVDPDPKALENLSERQRGAMLLPVLHDRFHLQAHTETRTLPVYELVVTKSGQKFKPAGEHQGSSGIGLHNEALTVTDISMADFAGFLEEQVHRTVVDKTGLAGNYDFAMKFARTNAAVSAADDAPSIFTALEEQLGLKLQPAKGPVETLVVDHVEMPSEN
jgi:uncharacterized protein (TIGR03435 family)